ncbi:MAG: IS110 family transposase, partial [Proteobacteria bacterium]|nr:IS110 family transposase [Pseudomonadota bacterium]
MPIKSAQQQADTMILKHRDMLVSQRTQAITGLLAAIAQADAIPATARDISEAMGAHIADLDAKLDAIGAQLAA